LVYFEAIWHFLQVVWHFLSTWTYRYNTVAVVWNSIKTLVLHFNTGFKVKLYWPYPISRVGPHWVTFSLETAVASLGFAKVTQAAASV